MRLEIVVAACVVNDDRVLLVWHKRHREWLPPGGHVEVDETPDDAVVREVKEETGLDVAFIDDRLPVVVQNVKRQLPVPFFADVHSVGDHDHCCFYYLVRPQRAGQSVILKLSEVENFGWFEESKLRSDGIPQDVSDISRMALARYRENRNLIPG
jgi:ADP-ribose pyrophosphatase YjhB (NUDIX family)